MNEEGVEYQRVILNVPVYNLDYLKSPFSFSRTILLFTFISLCNSCEHSFCFITIFTSCALISLKICGHYSPEEKLRKRDVPISFENPREYVLVKINRTFPNTPPVIVTSTLMLTEDESAIFHIETKDNEDDVLEFAIIKQSENVVCNITQGGKLKCKPKENFYGSDFIRLQVTETDLPPFESPYSVNKTVNLQVVGVPDKTERFFIDTHYTFFSEIAPHMEKNFVVNANRSSDVFVGWIVLADVDGGEIFTETTNFTDLENSTFSLKKINAEENPFFNHSSKDYRSIAVYETSFRFSPKSFGKMTLKFIAQTSDSKYTPSITINVFVLEHPCMYGECIHSIPEKYTCNDTMRSQSFSQNGYYCVCTPGIYFLFFLTS